MAKNQIETIYELAEGIEREEKHPLKLYRPWALQEPFHRASCSEQLLWGGKRSGKTCSVSMEFVSRVTGNPITLADGTEIPIRFPVSSREFPRQYWVIGWNWDHSSTIFKYLFRKGQGGTLRCIRNRDTGKWRMWNRANPDDVAREKESQLTPPLIPPEMIVGGYRGIAWEEPKKFQWKCVTLTNGATIVYFPSNQVTAQPGEAVSGIWIDEDIQNPGHIQEWQDRLIDMRGWFLWSVWPQTRNNALLDLMDRANANEGDEKSQIRSFQLDMLLNPYIAQDSKDEALARMENDDEIARRTRGDMNLPSLLMYEKFEAVTHCLRNEVFDKGMQADAHPVRVKLTELLKNDGRLPRTWTRYLSMDPSHTRTACHSWVVPPPTFEGAEMGNIAIVEWELILARKTADEIALELKPLMSGLPYEAFVIDQNMGRTTAVGRDDTVAQHFEAAFRKHGLVSHQTLSGFLWGSNQPATRHRTIRRMLAVQTNGMPLVLFVEHRIPQTKKEFSTYKKEVQVGRDGVRTMLDKPSNPRVHDAMASVEYGGTLLVGLMDQGIAYVEPSFNPAHTNPILKAIEDLKTQGSGTDPAAPNYVHFGPGRAA